MALFPKIQSPCPYKDNLASFMDGDMCRMCNRQVFDLTDMTDLQRITFMKGCRSEVCVSYRVPARAVIAAATIAAASIAFPAVSSACEATEDIVVTMGGIQDPANVEYQTDTSAASLPQLPIVYDPS